jgi:KDO2-lipid IV(A) lauroyltransferase
MPGRVLVALLSRALAALPAARAEALGRAIGDARRVLNPREAEAVRANLERLFRSAPAEDIGRWTRDAFRAFGLFAVEFLRGLRQSPQEIAAGWDLTGGEHLEALRDDPRGFILVGAHTGNWEQLGAIASLLGRRIVAPADTQFHPILSGAVRRAKRRWRVDSVPPDRELRGLLRALQRGDLVALPLDGGSFRLGTAVDLLGRRVRLAGGAARLAVLTGRPAVAVFSRRAGFMRQRVTVEAPIRPDPGRARPAEFRRLAQLLADRLGDHLARARGEWCIFRALEWGEE